MSARFTRLVKASATVSVLAVALAATTAPASAQSPDLPPTCDPLVPNDCPYIPNPPNCDLVSCDPSPGNPPAPCDPFPCVPPLPVPCSDVNDPYCTTWVDPVQTTGDCAYVNVTGEGDCPAIHVGSRILGYESGSIYLPNAGRVLRDQVTAVQCKLSPTSCGG